MATGEEPDGRATKNTNILSSLPPLLQSTQSYLIFLFLSCIPNHFFFLFLYHSKEDKIRLLITYIVSQEGIKDSDRKRLIELAAISSDDENSIANLRFLGITLSKV